MRFSVMVWPYSGQTVDPVVRLACTAEEHGFEAVYVGDSQMLWNDVWVCLAACALNTRRVSLGPGVTNTITRHPAVTANAAMTLNMLSNGRAMLGLGAGDSAVRTVGLSPARIPVLRERVEFIRALLRGEEVQALPWEGARQGTWGQEQKVKLIGAESWGAVPIQIAVMSPKSAAVAAEISEGVIVDGHMGGNFEGASATVQAVADGARRAGKDLSSVRVIAALDAAVDDDRSRALDKVRPTAARNIARKPWLPKTLGEEHAEVVRAVSEAYRFYEHLDLTAKHRGLIPDEVAMKCCIAGTPEDCIGKARELRSAGVTDIAIFVTTQDEEYSHQTIERFAKEVIPFI